MKEIQDYLQQPIVVKAKGFLKLKKEIDSLLPHYLTVQYNLSIDSNNNPLILVNNAVWLLQLKQFEAEIKEVFNKSFSNNCLLLWKVKPGLDCL